MKKVVAALLVAVTVAIVSITSPNEAQAGGQCFSIKPICPPGAAPVCVCTGPFGTNCSWLCSY